MELQHSFVSPCLHASKCLAWRVHFGDVILHNKSHCLFTHSHTKEFPQILWTGLMVMWWMDSGQIRHVHDSFSFWQFDIQSLCVSLWNCHFWWCRVCNSASVCSFLCTLCLSDWRLIDGLTDLKMTCQWCHINQKSMTWQFTVLAPTIGNVAEGGIICSCAVG